MTSTSFMFGDKHSSGLSLSCKRHFGNKQAHYTHTVSFKDKLATSKHIIFLLSWSGFNPNTFLMSILPIPDSQSDTILFEIHGIYMYVAIKWLLLCWDLTAHCSYKLLVPLQPAPVHVPVVPPIQEETSKPADGATAVISERKRPESTWKLRG